MSANVGLSTPRGSGTSGYVQRNHAYLRPRDKAQPYPKDPDLLRHKQRQPDKQILAHERARDIEVKVFDLRDSLEEQGVDEDEIEKQCDALRKKLTAKAEGSSAGTRGLKKHQVHEMAAAKIQESEKLRRALGISKDYEEGGHWKKQEERLKESLRRKEDEEAALAQREREEMLEREEERSISRSLSPESQRSRSRSPRQISRRPRSPSRSPSPRSYSSRSRSRSRSRSPV